MLSDFWRVLLEGRIFSGWSDIRPPFPTQFITQRLHLLSWKITHYLVTLVITCNSREGSGCIIPMDIIKKVCFNWYRLRLIKMIFWRKLAAVSDNNLFRIFLYTNIWKKNWIFIVMQQIQRFVLYSSNDLNTFLSIPRRKRKGQFFWPWGSFIFFFFLRTKKVFKLKFSVFF